MAFADYLDLQTAVIEQVANPDIADVMPRLVSFAEARFNRELRTRDMMAQATITIAGGTAALPVGFLEAIGLFNAAGCEYIQQPIHSVKDRLDFRLYAIQNGNILCNADGEKVLDYYAAIPTLNASMTATNWLLAKYPALYLYGVAYEAAKHLRDVAGAQAFKELYGMEFNDMRADDRSTRYSRARIVVTGVTP